MLQREQVFSDFVDALEDEGFDVATTIVDCADYGVASEGGGASSCSLRSSVRST